MFREIVTHVTIVCFTITLLSGCTSPEEISREAIPPHEELILEVITLDGAVYKFQPISPSIGGSTYGMLVDSTIVGQLENGQIAKIPVSSVKRVYVLRTDAVKTTFAVLGVAAAAIAIGYLIVLATKESCPFVYSYDGTRYVFDGEPYGGAICEGLKRTDWARLEYLKPVDGEYRLLLTNEVDETQFTDELKLWIIDHRADSEVILDLNGNAYTVGERVKLLSARDNQGIDQILWVGENDGLFWESTLDSRDPRVPSGLRDSLRLVFPREQGARSARLVVSASTTLWGSQMLKRMTQLRGRTVPQWYEEMKTPAGQEMLALWNLREELYHLQVRVRVRDTWVTRATILGGGPFVTEERVVPLDLEGVEGDTVEILLTPPAGFWQLNSFAMDYTPTRPVEIREVAATAMIGDEGEDLLDILSATDGMYYAAPRNGQTASIVFPAPAEKPGMQRTVFAKASGYYEMHMDLAREPETDVLLRIATEPGYPALFALEEYQRWKSELSEVRRP